MYNSSNPSFQTVKETACYQESFIIKSNKNNVHQGKVHSKHGDMQDQVFMILSRKLPQKTKHPIVVFISIHGLLMTMIKTIIISI